MITVRYAKDKRKRDRKRHRLLITFGNLQFHISQEEGHRLFKELSGRLNLERN